MSRPKAVNFKTFPLYDKYHTEKVKMYSGVEITALYKIKETKNFYLSLETWDESVSVFLLRLNDNKNIFEIPKCNKLEYFQRVLMAFCRFKFHDNFNGYSHYYKSIYPYVLKNLNNE